MVAPSSKNIDQPRRERYQRLPGLGFSLSSGAYCPILFSHHYFFRTRVPSLEPVVTDTRYAVATPPVWGYENGLNETRPPQEKEKKSP